MTAEGATLRTALRTLLQLVDDEGDEDDNSGGNGSGDIDPDGNGGDGGLDPVNTESANTSYVGTSVISLSDLMRSQPSPSDETEDEGSARDHGDWSYDDLDRPSTAAEPPEVIRSLTDEFLMPNLPNVALQAWWGGDVRLGYEMAVSNLGGSDSLSRTLVKTIDRAFTPPIVRGYLNLARPELGSPAPGVTDEFWISSYFGGEAATGSAGSSNSVANALGTVGRVLGPTLLAVDAILAIRRTALSDDPGRTGASELGRFAGSLAGGVAGGYIGSEGTAWLLAEVLGVAAVGPWAVAAGVVGLTAAVAGGNLFGAYGSAAASKAAAELQAALFPPP